MSLWGVLARLALTKGDLPALIAYAILVGLLSLATPLAVQALVSTVAFGTLLQPVIALATLLLGGLAFAALLRALQIRLLEMLQERAMVRLGISMAGRLPHLSVGAYEKLSADAIANRFFDIITVQKSGATLLLDAVALILQTTIAMVLLALYHPVFLAFNVLLLLSIAVIFWGLGRGAYKTALKESKQKHYLAEWLGELSRPYEVWRTTEGAVHGLVFADELAQNYLTARRAHYRVLFRQIIGALSLQVIGSTLLLVIGGWLVIREQLTLGQLVAAELIVSAVLVGLAKLGKHLEKLYDLLAAADKLQELESLPIEERGESSLAEKEVPASLTIEHLRFSYPNGATVLDGASLRVRPQTMIGICGESGTGKSTLAALLSGSLHPTSGSIQLDEIEQRWVSPQMWRRDVSRVSGPEIFSGTISDNVAMGDPTISPEVQHKILSALGILDEVGSLPKGLETLLRADGIPLSRGQAIRLTLARVLLRKPRLLILDGILDELSPMIRDRVLAYVKRTDSPWTLICISNHESVLSRCDEVYQIKEGSLHLLPIAKQHQGTKTSSITPR